MSTSAEGATTSGCKRVASAVAARTVLAAVLLVAVLLVACGPVPRNERNADSVEEAAKEAVDRFDDITWSPEHAHPASVDADGVGDEAWIE